MRWRRRAVRDAVAGAALASASLACDRAAAFDLVEHATLTIDAAKSLPAPAREALDRALAALRVDAGRGGAPAGLAVCAHATTGIGAGVHRGCTPLGTWPALAADHYPTEDELLAAIGPPVAAILSGAASAERRALELRARLSSSDFDEVAQARSDVLRGLDLYQTVHHGWFTDDGYVELATRGTSHFSAADEPLERQLSQLVAEGRVDRALAQATVHHLRSLQLAREHRRTGRPWVLARALAAHAFAVHFVQDAHAAGHAVMTAADFSDADGRMRRHDYFGFRGLGMTFALAEVPCTTNVAIGAERGWPSPCWTAFGDGNVAAPGRDRAIDGTAQLQLQLAMALEPALATGWRADGVCPAGESDGEPLALCAPPPGDLDRAAQLLDPHPPWTMPAGYVEPRGVGGCARAALIVATAEQAIGRLDGAHRIPAITTDAPDGQPGATPVRGVVTAAEVGRPLDRCGAPGPGETIDALVDPLCRSVGPGRAALGSPGASLLRPVLARWPVPQATASSLVGEAGNGRGWGWQVVVGAQGARTLEGQSIAFPFVAFGVAPRFQDLFPQESSFAPVELNLGLGPTVLWPDAVVGAAAFAEVRVPFVAIVPAALWDLATDELAPAFISEIAIVPHGFRLAYDLEREALRWDLEVLSAHVPLGSTFLPHRADLLPADLRLRVGRDHGIEAWTFGLELIGGATGMFDGT